MPKALDVTAVTKHAQLDEATYHGGRLTATLSRELGEETSLVFGIRRKLPERQGQAVANLVNQFREAVSDGQLSLDEVIQIALRSDVSGLLS